MSTPDRIRELLPLALLFVKAKLWLEADNKRPDESPSNVFRTPEEGEDFEKKNRDYNKLQAEQDDKRKNYLEMLDRFNVWNDDDKPRSLNHLLYGNDEEAPIKVIVSYENLDYLVYTDSRGNLAYTNCV